MTDCLGVEASVVGVKVVYPATSPVKVGDAVTKTTERKVEDGSSLTWVSGSLLALVLEFPFLPLLLGLCGSRTTRFGLGGADREDGDVEVDERMPLRKGCEMKEDSSRV